VFPDEVGLADGAAAFVTEVAAGAIAERGRFAIALSGGETPRPVYERLARPELRRAVAWENVHVFFGDERCVPPDDPRSNYRMVREAWLARSDVPWANVHRIRGEDDPEVEAVRYEAEVRSLFRTRAIPAFDLILLGIGDDGHTASLFPGTAALHEQQRLVVALDVAVMGSRRVTFTPPLINAARSVAFLARGAAKADMLWNVLEGPYQPELWPSQLVRPAPGELHWLVDAAAAARVAVATGPDSA
jgi:6-phosphogluconolactonase